MNQDNQIEKKWYVANWSLLAWFETVVKAAALILGIITFFQAFGSGSLLFPTETRLTQWIIQAVLSLGLIAAIFDRLKEKEIIAMGFVILNNLGHWGILIALMSSGWSSSNFTIFWALMLLGDLIKLVFLKVTKFTVRDTPPAAMYGLTLFYVVGYLVLIGLQVF